MMVGITLWMASMDDLPPEAYAFYVIFARGTMCGILWVSKVSSTHVVD